jgi:hypothetical protein
MADDVQLPTADEIRQLPRWARVAFVARCARRVLPLFKHDWPNAPMKYVRAVERAVAVAEQFAVAHTITSFDAANLDFVGKSAAATNHLTAMRAVCVAERAAVIVYYARELNTRLEVDCAREGASQAVQAAASPEIAAGSVTSSLIAKDFRTLLAMSLVDKWTDDTPVPPDVFGPLWPDGVPEGWPVADELCVAPTSAKAETADTFKLCLRAVAKPGVPADVIHKHAVELFKALNEYSLEKYGRRLTKDNFRRLVLECTGQAVPS